MDSNVETKSHRLSIVINVMWKSNLQDIPLLLNLLKSNHPFKEISSDKVLYDREITDFLEVMVFLIKSTLSQDTAGAIYIWSRMESSMEYVGLDLREALINYLFHQDNICYIIEETHEIISSQQLNSIKKLVNGQIQSRLLNWY
ncbi:17666_t:CDS:2 [Funneliformis geosporum]|uniref:17666_t:CDS:1 n=1 Tax=Funneliformis geosporum TaxID=1117311 RepID=A0A9W4WPB5_9GLOM|nr:17666_t:CDS:2 [Funneliformis geosporum]